jgi:hypothetical protein
MTIPTLETVGAVVKKLLPSNNRGLESEIGYKMKIKSHTTGIDS